MLRYIFVTLLFILILFLIAIGSLFVYTILMPTIPEVEEEDFQLSAPEEMQWNDFKLRFSQQENQSYLTYLKLLSTFPKYMQHKNRNESFQAWSRLRRMCL